MPKSRCWGGSREMSRPPCQISPLPGRSSPAIARSRVVLPQPEGPRKQTNSPCSMAREISLRAWKAPKCLLRCLISR
ncbi:hypothetical protein D3C72_1719640 [compost metagenome]